MSRLTPDESQAMWMEHLGIKTLPDALVDLKNSVIDIQVLSKKVELTTPDIVTIKVAIEALEEVLK